MHYNRHVYLTAVTMSILLALAAMLNHGVFEIRQGFTSTNGFFIEAISEADRFWYYGSEAAFTIVHNFLLTGIIVVVISFLLIVFSIKYLAAPKRAGLLLAFFVLLSLFGGGIGHIVVFLPTWGFATCIHSPLRWYEKNIPKNVRMNLSRLWLFFLVTACFSWLVVMYLGVFGYIPGLSDPNITLNIVIVFLLATTVLLSIAFMCAMARDLQVQE